MDIENLGSLLFQSPSGVGVSELQSLLLNTSESAGSATFFEQLAEQMTELGDPEQLQIFVEGLNPEVVTAKIELPEGNILPHAAVLMPESVPPVNDLVADELDELTDPVLQSPKPINLFPTALQSKAVTTSPTTSDLAPKDNTKLSTSLLPATEIPEIEQADVPVREIKDFDLKVLEKTDSNAPVVAKGELVNAQPSVRTQPGADKTPVIAMDRPVNHPEWKQELGDRVVWMARSSMATAELKVNPPQMGPIEVRINMNQDQTNIVFASQNAAVREAIEAAVPRLRELLGVQQLNLMNVDVSNSFADHRQQQASGEGGSQSRGGAFSEPTYLAEESLAENVETIALAKTQGLLNYYV